jgi:hypothetical protein
VRRFPRLITERLQDAWYAVEDAALAAGRATGDFARGLSDFWFDLSTSIRRGIGLALGGLGALPFALAAGGPGASCQAPGGDTCPPADDAIHLVPEDALAYVRT